MHMYSNTSGNRKPTPENFGAFRLNSTLYHYSHGVSQESLAAQVVLCGDGGEGRPQDLPAHDQGVQQQVIVHLQQVGCGL